MLLPPPALSARAASSSSSPSCWRRLKSGRCGNMRGDLVQESYFTKVCLDPLLHTFFRSLPYIYKPYFYHICVWGTSECRRHISTTLVKSQALLTRFCDPTYAPGTRTCSVEPPLSPPLPSPFWIPTVRPEMNFTSYKKPNLVSTTHLSLRCICQSFTA